MRDLLKSTLGAVLLVAGSAGWAQAAPSAERGDYLVNSIMACGSCHTPIGPTGFDQSKALSGRLVEDIPAFKAISANITPGSEVTGWTDAQLMKAIREGIRPDGSLIGPPMPFEVYKGISDDDLASIVMYLRTVPAVDSDPGESEYHIPLPPAYGPPVEHVASVAEGPTAEYGAYLAGPLGHCIVCHTKFDEQGMAQFDKFLGAGGNAFVGPWGSVVSANVTPEGLSKYTDAQVAMLIATGTRPDGTKLTGPMAFPYYAKLKPDDLTAIVAYLRSLPAIPTP